MGKFDPANFLDETKVFNQDLNAVIIIMSKRRIAVKQKSYEVAKWLSNILSNISDLTLSYYIELHNSSISCALYIDLISKIFRFLNLRWFIAGRIMYIVSLPHSYLKIYNQLMRILIES